MKRIIIVFMCVLFSLSCSKKSTTDPDGQDTVTLHGKIVKVVSNENYYYLVTGLETATVTLEPGHRVFTTGSSGEYSFSGLEPGFYSLTISKEGYYSKSDQFQISLMTTRNFNYYLERKDYSIPHWQNFPYGTTGGINNVGGEGLYVYSKGSSQVYSYVELKFKNFTKYDFEGDMFKDPATSFVGFFIKSIHTLPANEKGEYWNLESWKHAIVSFDIKDMTVVDSELVWQDGQIIDTLHTYPDSVMIMIQLKAEGGLSQGVFNNIKFQYRGDLK